MQPVADGRAPLRLSISVLLDFATAIVCISDHCAGHLHASACFSHVASPLVSKRDHAASLSSHPVAPKVAPTGTSLGKGTMLT